MDATVKVSLNAQRELMDQVIEMAGLVDKLSQQNDAFSDVVTMLTNSIIKISAYKNMVYGKKRWHTVEPPKLMDTLGIQPFVLCRELFCIECIIERFVLFSECPFTGASTVILLWPAIINIITIAENKSLKSKIKILKSQIEVSNFVMGIFKDQIHNKLIDDGVKNNVRKALEQNEKLYDFLEVDYSYQ